MRGLPRSEGTLEPLLPLGARTRGGIFEILCMPAK
jgi:hypothetical protein